MCVCVRTPVYTYVIRIINCVWPSVRRRSKRRGRGRYGRRRRRRRWWTIRRRRSPRAAEGLFGRRRRASVRTQSSRRRDFCRRRRRRRCRSSFAAAAAAADHKDSLAADIESLLLLNFFPASFLSPTAIVSARAIEPTTTIARRDDRVSDTIMSANRAGY